MGEINLIPGQQVKGRPAASAGSAGGVEYSRPTDEQLAPKAPPKPGWWARRAAAKAAAKLTPAPVQPAKPKIVATPAPTSAPKNDFFPVEIDLLADVKKPIPTPLPPAPRRRSIQAEPDFISDAGFKAYVAPRAPLPSTADAYYVRRPVKHTASPTPLKQKKKEQHHPSGPPVSLIDVNLIPREFGLAAKPKHLWAELIRYVVVSVILVGAAYGGLRWYDYKLTTDTANLKAQVAVLDQQIGAYSHERAQATAVQDQLVGLTAILDRHLDYSEFFSFIEANTLPSVYYKNVNVDSRTGAVTTAAVTTDFDQLRAQVAVLEDNPLVSGVTVNSATRTVPTTPTGEAALTGVSTLLFSLTFSVDTSVFHP